MRVFGIAGATVLAQDFSQFMRTPLAVAVRILVHTHGMYSFCYHVMEASPGVSLRSDETHPWIRGDMEKGTLGT